MKVAGMKNAKFMQEFFTNIKDIMGRILQPA
jgi:hypothetical protein